MSSEETTPRIAGPEAAEGEKSVPVVARQRLTPHTFEEHLEEKPLAYPLSLESVPAQRTTAYAGLRRNLMVGLVTLGIFAGGVSTIVAQTVIAGAVIAHGNIVVESGAKTVQHLTGGIVKETLVKENEVVHIGQPLIKLDVTLVEAQARAARISLAQQRARLDRLIAERDGLDQIQFSEDSQALRADPDFAEIFDTEERQHRLRIEERNGQRAQLRERIEQAKQETAGNVSQLEARQNEIELLTAELDGIRALFKKKLVSQQRMKELERQQSQLVGTIGALQSSIAAGKGKISELELMILQVDQNLRSQITDQISNAQQAIASLTEREIEAKTMLLQSTIYAPQSGTVYQLAVHTRGQVIKGGETLMTIVPERDTLVGLVKVSPADIDQLYSGQQTLVTFSAFDRGTTPTINASLSSISPDLKQDPQMGTLYYQARIAVSPEEMERLGAVDVVPGMPIEVFINTGDRTLVSYFLKPLTDQMNRAFR